MPAARHGAGERARTRRRGGCCRIAPHGARPRAARLERRLQRIHVTVGGGGVQRRPAGVRHRRPSSDCDQPARVGGEAAGAGALLAGGRRRAGQQQQRDQARRQRRHLARRPTVGRPREADGWCAPAPQPAPTQHALRRPGLRAAPEGNTRFERPVPDSGLASQASACLNAAAPRYAPHSAAWSSLRAPDGAAVPACTKQRSDTRPAAAHAARATPPYGAKCNADAAAALR